MRAQDDKLTPWVAMLGPPTLWFVHFGFVYASASLEMMFTERATLLSRLVIAGGTLLFLAVIGWLGWKAPRFAPVAGKVREFWIGVTRITAAVSAIAVVYQAMPALLV